MKTTQAILQDARDHAAALGYTDTETRNRYLLAMADVTRSEFSSVASTSTAYIQQNWWKWIVFLILGVIAAFLILLVLLQIRRRRLRRLRLEKRRRDLEKQYRRRYREDREE